MLWVGVHAWSVYVGAELLATVKFPKATGHTGAIG